MSEGALLLPNRYGTAVVARLAVCQARFLADRGQVRAGDGRVPDASRQLRPPLRFSRREPVALAPVPDHAGRSPEGPLLVGYL